MPNLCERKVVEIKDSLRHSNRKDRHYNSPLDLKSRQLLDVSNLSAAQLNSALEKGYKQILEGKGIPSHIAFEALRKKYHF